MVPVLRGEVVARYRATTCPKGRATTARQPRLSLLSRARPGGLGARGASGAGPRGLDNSDAQLQRNIPCPRDKRGPFARAAGWSGRPGCKRGWAATMSVLMQRISNRQKIGQMLYLRAVTALWRRATHSAVGNSCRAVPRDNLSPYRRLSRGTARQSRPLGEVVARYRATTSPLMKVVARCPDRATTSPLRGVVARHSATTSPLRRGYRAAPRDNLAL